MCSDGPHTNVMQTRSERAEGGRLRAQISFLEKKKRALRAPSKKARPRLAGKPTPWRAPLKPPTRNGLARLTRNGCEAIPAPGDWPGCPPVRPSTDRTEGTLFGTEVEE